MIKEISEALTDVVHRATPDLDTWVELHSLSAADQAPTTNRGVLALIAAEPHPHLVNRPLVEGTAGLVRAPVFLQLHYLITYFGAHEEAQTRLARVVQAFHTTPILGPADLQPPLADEVASLTVRLLSPGAEERNQIWGMLGRPGRFALYYAVDVAPVDVLERDGAGRVTTHRVQYVGVT